MIFEDSCQSRSWMDRSLHLANEKGLETARTVVPLQSLAIPIPQLEAVFFLAVLVSVTKRIVDSCFALSPHSIEHFISREKQCFSVNMTEHRECTHLKLFGSPTFQFSKVMGLPLAIQKKVPSSAWSVPEVQKCSCPRPKSLMCFSSLSFSSCDAMLARCIP